jgi:aryl-alcohol dehydrogenase-like predicted oxidoreductase
MTNDAIAPLAPSFPRDWPRLGMGCAPLGDLFQTYPEPQAAETFAAAWEAGVRYYDTAPWYGHGLSEHRLGALLRQHPRSEFLVSTKVGRVYRPAGRNEDARVQWKGGLNFGLRFDYSAEGFEASLEQSRLRLGQPAVDALVIHDLDQGYHGAAYDGHMRDLTGSGLAALHRLRADGEIAAVGMGINALEDFSRVADWIELDFFLVAMPYTLLDQAALTAHGALRESGIRSSSARPSLGAATNPSDRPDVRLPARPRRGPRQALTIESRLPRARRRRHGRGAPVPCSIPAVCRISRAVAPDSAENAAERGAADPGELWPLKARG